MSCTSRLAPRFLPRSVCNATSSSYTSLPQSPAALFSIFLSFIRPARPNHKSTTLVVFSFSRPVLFRHPYKTTGFYDQFFFWPAILRVFWPAIPRFFFARPVPFFLQITAGFLHDPSLFSYEKTAGFLHDTSLFPSAQNTGFCSSRPFFPPDTPWVLSRCLFNLQQDLQEPRVVLNVLFFLAWETHGFFPSPRAVFFCSSPQ